LAPQLSRVKDDHLDAWSFADALRVDGQDWKALRPEELLIGGSAFAVGLSALRIERINDHTSFQANWRSPVAPRVTRLYGNSGKIENQPDAET
jgi:hypothetical protein